MHKHGLAQMLKRVLVVQTTRVRSQGSSGIFQALVYFLVYVYTVEMFNIG